MTQHNADGGEASKAATPLRATEHEYFATPSTKGKPMTPDLAELKRIAEAASPGPWRGDRIDGSVKYDLLDANGDPVIRGDNGNVADTGCYGVQSDEDEAYLLAFDPPTCLALIARIEALEAGTRAIFDVAQGMNPDQSFNAEGRLRRCAEHAANLLGDRHD